MIMRLENLLKKSLDIKRDDSVLIVTDRRKERLGKKFYTACKKLSDSVELAEKPVGKRNGEEPPKNIASAMKSSNVVIALTTHSLTHTDATRAAWKNGTRIASMPGFTESMMSALLIEPGIMERRGRKVHKYMEHADNVRITTENGTDIIFSIKNRIVYTDSGFIKNSEGDLGNLPAGEVSVSPIEGTANGVVVVGSMGSYAKSGTIVKVRGGLAYDVSDTTCKLAKIFNTVKNSRNVAEFGIGINPKARLIGNILLDEKVAGTCHIAFGNNVNYGGKINSKFHADAILLKPTIFFDGKLVMKNGKLLL